VKSLEVDLRALRESGRTALVPYVVAGMTPDWTRYVEAAVLGGADAVEIGVPFSDPMIDGVVIQAASQRALERGTTLDSICEELDSLDAQIPLIAMTYYNLFLHYGLARAAGRLRQTGLSGAIVPDLPLEEAHEWRVACDAGDVACIYLIAPSTPAPRAREIAIRTQGFAYATARMAVTGAASDDGEGPRVVSTLREASDVPVYVGIGISTPEQAKRAAAYSDGVIVGSALVKLILDGASTSEVERFVGSFRAAID
jgi:tryptophan synthase alpha chain